MGQIKFLVLVCGKGFQNFNATLTNVPGRVGARGGGGQGVTVPRWRTLAPVGKIEQFVGERHTLGNLKHSYSQLSPCGHPAITDTPLLLTDSKSPAETTMKYIEITLAITDSCYYGIRTLRAVPN